MNGAWASLASRRLISVLPTPVGPIIRMFLGVTSCLRSSGSCCRRQRLRSATATARLASSCPPGAAGPVISSVSSILGLNRLERDVLVGVDADLGGDLHRLAGDGLGIEIGV